MGLGIVKTSWTTVILPPYSSSISLGYLYLQKNFHTLDHTVCGLFLSADFQRCAYKNACFLLVYRIFFFLSFGNDGKMIVKTQRRGKRRIWFLGLEPPYPYRIRAQLSIRCLRPFLSEKPLFTRISGSLLWCVRIRIGWQGSSNR